MPKKSSKSSENKRYQPLCQALDYKFAQQEWLIEALTRQSAIQEGLRYAAKRDYQRLEFVGDRVLNFSALLLLLQQYSQHTEEMLINLCIQLTANEGLLPLLGRELKLERYFIKGRAERVVTDKMYADGVEALLGAVCLDGGCYQAQRVAKKLLFPYLAVICAETFSESLASELPDEAMEEVDEIAARGVSPSASLANLLLEEADDSHFDGGVYEFRKIVLSWTLGSIQHPLKNAIKTEPLPAEHAHFSLPDYYDHFKPLILEEARATLNNGVELVKQGEKIPLELTVTRFKQARNKHNPSVFEFSGRVNASDDCRGSAIGLLLIFELASDHCFLLALADLQDGQNQAVDVLQRHLKAKVVLPDHILLDESLDPAFEKGACWQGYVLGPLITYMRMYDVCTRQPVFDFWQEVLAGRIGGHRRKQIKKQQALKAVKTALSLNPSQQAAVDRFVALESGLHLLQGPPGTGKTTTVTAMLDVFSKRGKKVVVCAPSNKAVHVLAERFIGLNADVPVALSGVPFKLPDHLQSVFIHGWGALQKKKLMRLLGFFQNFLAVFTKTEEKEKKSEKAAAACHKPIDFSNNFLRLQQQIKALFELVHSIDHQLPNQRASFKVNEIICLAKQVLRCQSGMKSSREAPSEEFLQVLNALIAEIQLVIKQFIALDIKPKRHSQSTVLEALLLDEAHIIFCTLSVAGRQLFNSLDDVDVLIIDEAGQAVEAETLIPLRFYPSKCLLVGDVKQLPATTMSQEADERHFHWSMLSRFIEECHQDYDMLTIQYRMHPDIREWPSDRHYDGRLVEDRSVLTRVEQASRYYQPPFIVPCMLMDVAGQEMLNGTSYYNKAEAERVISLLELLEARGVDLNEQVGIITFYTGQVAYLSRQLAKRPAYRQVKVSTVDSFQGDERDFIIISFVRANRKGRIGFLNDFRRLNVAVTRARLSLLMVGHVPTLMHKRSDVELLCESLSARNLIMPEQRFLDFLAQRAAPAKQAVVPCRFFARGHCRHGKACHFSHDRGAAFKQPRVLTMKNGGFYEGLMEMFAYRFRQIPILLEALTRQSAIEEHLAGAAERNNQQLKILGDKVLRLCFSIVLLGKFSCLVSEAQLHDSETELISQASLVNIARKLKLEKYVIRGEGERELTDQMYADSMKSLMGAIFRDAQQFDAMLKAVEVLYSDKIHAIVAASSENADPSLLASCLQ